jgi:hypothetical protein
MGKHSRKPINKRLDQIATTSPAIYGTPTRMATT